MRNIMGISVYGRAMSNWKPKLNCGLNLASMLPMIIFPNNRLSKTNALVIGFIACLLASMSLTVRAAQPSLDQLLTTEDARHLFSRTGFGYSLAQHDQAGGLTRREAIDLVMQGFATNPSVAMPAWVTADAPFHWARRDMNRTQRVRFERDRDQELGQLRQWWISEMLQSPSPQTERLVLFWHDLMATSYHGVNYQSLAMAKQNAMFRQHGLGNFGDLLKALIRDPAMLNYLDNENSRKQSPNENLARELLERFSMGEGNYTEKTVKEAARALTGYSVSHDYNLSFRFETWKHDTGDKELFGQTGKFNGDDLVDLILKQPASAEFIAGRFWHLLVSDSQPTQADIAPLVEELRSNQFDLATLYQSILMSEAFWQTDNRIARVKSPIILQVAAARSLEYPKLRWQTIPVTSASIGMSIFAPPNVSGWHEGTAYTTAGRLKQRNNVIDMLLGLKASGDASNASMVANEMQSLMGDSMMKASGITLTMAAEDYHGPVKYRVELRRGDDALWESADRIWMHGHDTLQFGRVNDMSNMPWQHTSVTPPIEHIERADKVRVYFLNDTAGRNGDRNLYVRGVSLKDNYFVGSSGTQQSTCVPKNSADAGNLYCNGYVDIPINIVALSENINTSNPYQVGNVRVRWGNVGKGSGKNRSRLELTLETVKAPDQQWRNIGIAMYSNSAEHADLRIDTYSCWPDCFVSTDECLWLDEIDGVTQTWVFPLDDEHQCHYQSLDDKERRLVDAIWMSLPEFIDHAAIAEKDRRYAKVLALWKQRIQTQQGNLNESRYAKANNRFVFNSALLRKVQPPAIVQAPEVLITAMDQLQSQLKLRGISVFDLLLPGVNVSAFPQLDASLQQPLVQQLRAYSHHAVSQLY